VLKNPRGSARARPANDSDSDDAASGDDTEPEDDVDMPDATAPNTSDGEDLEEEAEDALGEYLKTKAFGEADIEVRTFFLD
jgi:hypothetical protein